MSERIEIAVVVPGHSHFHDDLYAMMPPCSCGNDWTAVGQLLALGCEAETWSLAPDDPLCDQYGCTVWWTGELGELVRRAREWFMHETGCICSAGYEWRQRERAGE